jgi:hypothetical protein
MHAVSNAADAALALRRVGHLLAVPARKPLVAKEQHTYAFGAHWALKPWAGSAKVAGSPQNLNWLVSVFPIIASLTHPILQGQRTIALHQDVNAAGSFAIP